jgi:hypothetical protein
MVLHFCQAMVDKDQRHYLHYSPDQLQPGRSSDHGVRSPAAVSIRPMTYPPPYQQPWPPQQAPAQHRAAAPRRWQFWSLAAFHALVLLLAIYTLNQPPVVLFAVLGSGAAVDVMAAVMWWAWTGGPSRR